MQGAVQPQLTVCSETTTRPSVVVSTSTMVIPRTSVALPCVETPQTTMQVLEPSTIWAATTFPHPATPTTAMATVFIDADEIAGGAADCDGNGVLDEWC